QNLIRTSDTDWSMEPFAHRLGPFRDINAVQGLNVWATAETGIVTIPASAPVFTADHGGGLFYIEERELRAFNPWAPGWRDPTVGDLTRSDGKVYRCTSVATGGTDWVQTGSVRPTHDFGRAWDGPGDVKVVNSETYATGVEWQYVNGGFGIALITAFTS